MRVHCLAEAVVGLIGQNKQFCFLSSHFDNQNAGIKHFASYNNRAFHLEVCLAEDQTWQNIKSQGFCLPSWLILPVKLLSMGEVKRRTCTVCYLEREGDKWY